MRTPGFLKAKNIKYSSVLWGLFLFHLINNYVWLKLDGNCFTYDSHRYFLASLKIFDAYKNFPQHLWKGFFEAFPFQAPLVGMVSAPFYFILGSSQDVGVMINSGIFLGLLIFSTYKIGQRLMSEKAGLLAAFLVTAYPVVFNQLKVYMLDLPLTAMVALSIYLLIASDYFSDLKYSFLFGLACGAGMLTKQYFPLFIFGPLCYVIFKNIFVFKDGTRKQRTVNFLLSLAVTLVICLPYYIKNIPLILYKAGIRWTTTWPTPIPDSGWCLEVFRSLLWYLWGFINWQVSFFYFLLFLAGAVFYFRSKLAHKGFIYLWVIFSWVLVSCFRYTVGFNMEVTGVRYTLPILPAVALITAIGILQMPRIRIRVFAVTAAVMFGILQLFAISYPIFEEGIFTQLDIPLRLPEKVANYRLLPDSLIILNLGPWAVSGSDYNSYPLSKQDYLTANEEILRIIDRSGNSRSYPTVFVIPDNTQLWYLQYKSYIAKKNFYIICDWNLMGTEINMKKLEDDVVIEKLVLEADYIIDKSGKEMGESYLQSFVKKAKHYFGKHKEKYRLLDRVEWPDGSFILVYTKNRPGFSEAR